MGTASILVENITGSDPTFHPTESNGGVSDIPSSPGEISEPAPRQARARRSSRSRKNGNWPNEELFATNATYDNYMSMKKASEQFHIPYNSIVVE